MKQYLSFIEAHSIEKHFYMVASEIYKGQTWEIQWGLFDNNQSSQQKAQWRLKPQSGSTWSYHCADSFVREVSVRKLDVQSIEHHLVSHIKSLLAYVYMVKKEASDRFGEDFVEDSISEFKIFQDQLAKVIREISTNKAGDGDSLLAAPDKDSKKISNKNLRIIKE